VNTSAAPGSPYAIYGVYDGHGGFAVSEWLKTNLASVILEEWPKADFCLEAISQACLKADYTLIQPPRRVLRRVRRKRRRRREVRLHRRRRRAV
jgi:serine/threonine protein phosphatase PrpC